MLSSFSCLGRFHSAPIQPLAFLQHRGKKPGGPTGVRVRKRGGGLLLLLQQGRERAKAWGPKKGTQSDADTCQLKVAGRRERLGHDEEGWATW